MYIPRWITRVIFFCIIVSNVYAKKIILTEKETIQGYTLPKGTEIHLDGRGRLWRLRVIQTFNLKNLKLYGGEIIRFYANGHIKYIDPYDGKTPLIINGIPIAPKQKIYFHSNGNIKELTLNDKYSYNKIEFHAQDTLLFYRDGHLQTARIKTPTTIQGIDIHRYSKENYIGNEIDFFPGGLLKAFDAFTAYTIRGYPAAGSQRILLYPNGNIYRMKLSESIDYHGKTLKENVETFFKSNGQPDWQIIDDKKQQLIWQEQDNARVRIKGEKAQTGTKFRFAHVFFFIQDRKKYYLNLLWDRENLLNDILVSLRISGKKYRTETLTFPYEMTSGQFNLVLNGKKPKESYFRVTGSFRLERGIEDRVYYQLKLYDRRRKTSEIPF